LQSDLLFLLQDEGVPAAAQEKLRAAGHTKAISFTIMGRLLAARATSYFAWKLWHSNGELASKSAIGSMPVAQLALPQSGDAGYRSTDRSRHAAEPIAQGKLQIAGYTTGDVSP
jgi:hypothetical protein